MMAGVADLSTHLWPAILVVTLSVFLIPGILGAALLARRQVVGPSAVLLTGITLSSALGYTVFWAYFIGPSFGKTISLALFSANVAVVVFPSPARSLLWRSVKSKAVSVPLALMFLFAVFYNALLFSQGSHTPVELRAQQHLLAGGLPIDNFLPSILADRLYNGRDPREFFGDWKSSDRPPLQTGAILMQRPVSSGLGINDLHYQLLSSGLQCSWVAAVWALCGAGMFHRRGIAFTIVMAGFSGFFFLNSVFTWPKLLAASLVMLAYVLTDGKRPSVPGAALSALAVGLALLAHAGVIFTLLPLAAIVLVRRTRPPLVPAAAGVAVVLMLMAPWWAYSRFYDPPGNRLVKWHLAGVVPIDERSFSKTLADSYSAVGPSGAVKNKLKNLSRLMGERPLGQLIGGVHRWSQLWGDGMEVVRGREFFTLVWALGPLNMVWLPLLAWRMRRRWTVPHPQWQAAARMLALAGLGVLTWVLMMFGPGTTVIHQGSYATMILIWVGLSGMASTLPSRWSAALLAMQVAYFSAVWAFDLPGRSGALSLGDAGVAVVSAVLVLVVLARFVASDGLRVVGAD